MTSVVVIVESTVYIRIQWALLDSNQRPPACKATPKQSAIHARSYVNPTRTARSLLLAQAGCHDRSDRKSRGFDRIAYKVRARGGVLQSLKARGPGVPKLLVADGNLGIWAGGAAGVAGGRGAAVLEPQDGQRARSSAEARAGGGEAVPGGRAVTLLICLVLGALARRRHLRTVDRRAGHRHPPASAAQLGYVSDRMPPLPGHLRQTPLCPTTSGTREEKAIRVLARQRDTREEGAQRMDAIRVRSPTGGDPQGAHRHRGPTTGIGVAGHGPRPASHAARLEGFVARPSPGRAPLGGLDRLPRCPQRR